MNLRFYDITCTWNQYQLLVNSQHTKGKLDFEGNSKTFLTAVLKMLIIGLQYKTATAKMF